MRIILLSILFISTLLSKTTICYKENTFTSKIENSVLLDGGECKGKLSIDGMKYTGWKLKYSQATPKNSKYNHLIIFEQLGNKKAYTKSTQKTASKTVNKKQTVKFDFDTTTKEFTLNNINKNTAIINQENLKIGQSGIIIHKYSNKSSIVVATASVISSSKKSSKILIEKHNFLTQNAIPTTKLKPSNGDTFILNHLYSSSLLIAPNYETVQAIKAIYPKQNFFNPDIFASHLKITNKPIPTKGLLQNFCKEKDIGTIFIAVKNQFYILDVNSFKVLDTIKISVNDRKIQKPFYTKVLNIEKNFWDFGDSEVTDYNSFYTSLIDGTKYIPQVTTDEENNNKSVLQKVSDKLSKLSDMLPW